MMKENDDNLNKLCNRWLVNGILMDAGDMKMRGKLVYLKTRLINLIENG